MYCTNCGSPMDEKAVLCVKCGTEKGKGDSFCAHCGAAIQEKGQSVCMTCGYAIPKSKLNPKKLTKNIKTLIIGAIAVILVIILLASLSNPSNSVNFNKLYNEYCNSTWAEVGSDGSYLYIDTNPYDWDDDGIAYIDAYYAIEDINKELGLPESLIKDMGGTSSLDGKQTRTYEDIGREVSWKYHPDNGLEVTYSKLR